MCREANSPIHVLAVTNRALCPGDFLLKVEQIASGEGLKRRIPYELDGILLREKDLSAAQYEVLARQVQAICTRHTKRCILHSFPDVAERLCSQAVHLPFAALCRIAPLQSKFATIGCSIHSVEEAVEAQRLGATYLTAGHIFSTACKPGLPPRGLAFLQEVSRRVKIPVYAIGGIHPDNAAAAVAAGAYGVCMMSEFMKEETGEV